MPDQAVVVHGKLDTSYGASAEMIFCRVATKTELRVLRSASVVTWLLFDTLVHFDVEVRARIQLLEYGD